MVNFIMIIYIVCWNRFQKQMAASSILIEKPERRVDHLILKLTGIMKFDSMNDCMLAKLIIAWLMNCYTVQLSYTQEIHYVSWSSGILLKSANSVIQ